MEAPDDGQALDLVQQDTFHGQRLVTLGNIEFELLTSFELFKHHESVLTGHLKMMDMVRKHCVEGSGNHTTAQSCVDRTREMIRMFKQATWNFVCCEIHVLR